MTTTDSENATVRTGGIRNLSFTPEDNAKFKVELSIPLDAPFAAREIDGRDVAPKMEEGWTLRVFGIPLSFEEFAAFPADSTTPIHVSGEFEEQDGVRRVHIMNDLSDSPEVREFFQTHKADILTFSMLIMYSARLYHRAAPRVFAELRWHPALGFRAYIGGLQPSDNVEADARRAARVFEYFDDLQAAIRQRGKKEGDGTTWPGGIDDFLDDLWTTLEKRQESTGKPWGHDPTERAFRLEMRNTTSDRTVRDWLKDAGLRPQHIKSGAVTRANYPQFVSKQGPYHGR